MSQTALNTVRVTPPTDHAIFSFFEALLENSANKKISVQIADRGIGNFRTYDEYTENFPDLSGRGARLISQLSCQPSEHINVYFQRTITKFDLSGHPSKETSNWQNEIYVFSNRNPAPPPEAVSQVWSEVERFRKGRAIDVERPDASTSDLRDIVAVQLSQLADAQAQIVLGAEETRRRSEEAMEERRRTFEAELDQRRNDLQDQHKAALERLEEDRRSLEARKKELDDRGHMHARRELRSNITDSLKERLSRPGVSKEVRTLRITLGLAIIIAIAGFSAYAAYESLQLNKILSGSQNVSLVVISVAAVRTTAPLFVVAALLFYLLTWLRRTHAEDVAVERELERYRYDIDRASWAIETILEAQAKETGDVPEIWIEGVTRSLFARQEHRNEDREALEALGSLLNVAAKAEIGPGGTRVEIGRNGLRKMGKSSADDGA